MAKQPRRAVALRYDPATDAAPKVVAKGKGLAAEQIIKQARKHAVPVREDPALAAVLGRLNIDQEVPPEVYRAVAAILALLYRANRPG